MKLSLSVDGILECIEGPKETDAKLQLTKYFNSMAGYKINMQS